MAVQAPHWSNALSHDFRARSNALEELPLPTVHIGGTVLSGPHSDLTCIASDPASRKRSRDDFTPTMDPLPPLPTNGFSSTTPYANGIDTQMQRLLESRGTSTSGRSVSPAVPNELLSHLHSFTMEIDTLLRIQNERIRVGIEEATKRHCRGILASVGQQAERRLREMDAQLERERRKNAELEEKVRQISAESQVWFDAARNSEAMATALRSTLDQALLSAATAAAAEDPQLEDAHSCCYEGGDEADVSPDADVAASGRMRQCKVCGEREGCVLLLPCRHLCLCKECEPMTATCPVCCSMKNAALEVFLC
ncbi:SBP (S-ribonuclease binding protein) family protein [Rhynchospora pubera]|uniref:SBP (S-ribonuclease binding protein) family protein n=1 Tax=Rhynchospora pubera TaxID=906938 RepID=A0AAV8H9Y5_9POAL|nr:SBP (S-ribonuclease binding protein) family protein [Rhynchospora pubera]